MLVRRMPQVLVSLFALTIYAARLTTAASLPIYVEDSHAGTFFWLAEHLDLDQPYTLLQFDAHSDASAIFDSDKIRTALRRVGSAEERRQLLEKWRTDGTIQCFNWIEPLMPAPINRVIWIGDNADQTKAAAQLDGHLEAAPRLAGSFADRFTVANLVDLPRQLSPAEQLVVTIDLDSFTGLDEKAQAAAFQRTWDFVMRQPNVRAITFAISRPYLKSDSEANTLLLLALNAARLLPTAQIEFEPFATVAHDHSLRGQEFAKRGEPVPAFDVTRASEPLKAVLLAEARRLIVERNQSHWNNLLQQWRSEAARIRLDLRNAEPSTDGVWRMSSDDTGMVELITEPWMTKPDRVEWSVLLPAQPSCNVSHLDRSQVGFVADAAPRPQWLEKRITEDGTRISLGSLDGFLDPRLRCGSVRLRARAMFGKSVRETPMIEIRRLAGSGFRGAVTEQFGLPYLFGAGEMTVDGDTGAEANLGTDCANFVVYALRRQGFDLPWSDPKKLRGYLQLVRRDAKPGEIRFNSSQLESGLIVHLGTHVAAVLQDRPPLGLLDGNDIVAHQLKGLPETLPLSQLLSCRHQEHFDLYASPAADPAQALIFGGDVMLGRSCAEKIRHGLDPFACLRPLFTGSAFAAANLECVLTNQKATSRHGYKLAAPFQSAGLLRQAGFAAMSVANNHGLDFGAGELRQSVARLQQAGVTAIGVDQASPDLFRLPNGQNLAVVAANDVGSEATDLDDLKAALFKARLSADLLICMMHWGEENQTMVTDRQRELARWLIDHGADAVVGAHPHCLQPLDFYHGKPIAYSLGNLVFDGAPTVKAWNEGGLLRLFVSASGKIEGEELIPIRLLDGMPVAQEPDKVAPPDPPSRPGTAGLASSSKPRTPEYPQR